MDPRGTVGRIYKEDHYTLLHTKYERSGTCGFGEEDFFMFFPLHREQLSSLAPSAIIGFTEIPERLPVKLLLSDVHN